MKILIVDDDEISLELLGQTLISSGHQVETAHDGREALTILRRGDCRAVISDWEMPGMNGIDLCHAVREEALAGYIYFILLTGRDSSDDTIQGLSAGADDFLAKPFNPGELLVRMRTAERILSLETRDVAIFAMAKLAESRDPETGAHLERVRGYCKLLARQMARNPKFFGVIDAEYVNLIYLTSPLHDIGKVGIPDAVLLKPGRFTDEEFAIMKTHTTIGAKTLEAAMAKFPGARFLEMARDIAISHHEHVDGKGYPHGLAGENIPLCGRILAVADVYDALTTKRVYKEAFDHQTARGMILKDAGTHFDPDVIEAFLKMEAEFLVIKAEFEEQLMAA